jgi:hypothetical protein
MPHGSPATEMAANPIPRFVKQLAGAIALPAD